ncbi:hypothetical protein C8Q70DRAFT_258808 [Cubamyces menziesii]|nr:hypothetical protein C8Q70DRAFT_258808 [Cubamyces menziesii]
MEHFNANVRAIPFDVLLSIMEMSRYRTILTIAGTCRTLYYAPQSSRLLLRNGVLLRSSRAIESFLLFMLADPATRFKHLHALTFERGGFSEEAVDAIKNLLAHPLFNIDTLVLHDSEAVLSSGVPFVEGPNDDWSCAGTPLFEPFAGLTTIRHLTVDELGVRASTYLKMLPSALISVSIKFGSAGPSWNRLMDANAYNPIVILARSAGTLEVLKGLPFSLPLLGSTIYKTIYPRVRMIEIGLLEDWMRGVVAYAHAYPNLEHFSLIEPERPRGWDEYLRMHTFIRADLERRRRRNREDQITYGSWKSLQILEGEISAVYVLGLACKVSELRVVGVVEEDTAHYLEVVLSDVQPETLSLTVDGGSMFDEGSTLSRLLTAPIVKCITSLEMEVRFAEAEGTSDMKQITNNILLRTSGLLGLRKLTLVLNYALLTSPYVGPGSWSPTPDGSERYHCSAERYLSDLDFRAYASRFREAIPTLQRVVVQRRMNRTGDMEKVGPYGFGWPPSPASSNGEQVDDNDG